MREDVFNFIDKLLYENDIAFSEMGLQPHWSEPGWPEVAPDKQKEVYIEYVQNLYSMLDQLRKKHPNVEIVKQLESNDFCPRHHRTPRTNKEGLIWWLTPP